MREYGDVCMSDLLELLRVVLDIFAKVSLIQWVGGDLIPKEPEGKREMFFLQFLEIRTSHHRPSLVE